VQRPLCQTANAVRVVGPVVVQCSAVQLCMISGDEQDLQLSFLVVGQSRIATPDPNPDQLQRGFLVISHRYPMFFFFLRLSYINTTTDRGFVLSLRSL